MQHLQGLLGLYLDERRLKKHSQEVVPGSMATYVGPAELQTMKVRAVRCLKCYRFAENWVHELVCRYLFHRGI